MSDGITESRKKNLDKRRVFLGGTCNDSTWRDDLIPKLKIDFFNPVVEDWTHEAQQEEVKQRNECELVLYVITPRMLGFYSIAEVISDSYFKGSNALFCFLDKDKKYVEIPHKHRRGVVIGSSTDLFFSNEQKKSLIAVGNMVERIGGTWLKSMDEVVEHLNNYYE